MADHRPESKSPTTADLIFQLRSTFFATDFENVTKNLISREENMKKEFNNLKLKTESLEEKHKDELKKKQTEIDELKQVKCDLENKIRVSEQKFSDLNARVLSLEKVGKELISQQDNSSSPIAPAAVTSENSRQPFVSEKGGSNIKTKTKFPEIIQLDDEDDDDDDDDPEFISKLKRKRVSNETKKTCSSENEKRVRVKNEPNSRVFALDGSDNSSSDEDTKKVDSAYMSLVDKVKEERWKSEAHMLEEFEKDDDLCLNAICTIKRQNITLHGSDISRANILARWLMTGDPQGRLKKTASELNEDDLNYCRMCARKYVTQFFKVYQTKKDPFFPPQTSSEKR